MPKAVEGAVSTMADKQDDPRPGGDSPARSAEGSVPPKGGKKGHSWHGHFEPKKVPEGVFMRCDGCKATLFRKRVIENLNVCPECDHHFSISAYERASQVLDADTFEEWFTDLRPGDPLGFNDRRPYPERVKAEQDRTGLTESSARPIAASSWARWAPLSARN
jgi:hypothetical protein